LKHVASAKFWALYAALPAEVRATADNKNIAIFFEAWLLCVIGYALHLWLQPMNEFSSSTHSALNMVAILLSEPGV
jgi:hypothetical protein